VDHIEQLMDVIQTVNVMERSILGIDGLSRSGKSTLVRQLSQKLSDSDIHFVVFHMDDHIVERKHRYQTGNAEWYEYYYLQWDIDWLTTNFFNMLRESTVVSLPFYDPSTDTQVKKSLALSLNGLILIEGVFLQRKEWRAFYDYMVYLDCPREERFSRESAATQKQLTKFENRYWKAEEYYLNMEKPRESADLVLLG
jgi:uridine kinase